MLLVRLSPNATEPFINFFHQLNSKSKSKWNVSRKMENVAKAIIQTHANLNCNCEWINKTKEKEQSKSGNEKNSSRDAMFKLKSITTKKCKKIIPGNWFYGDWLVGGMALANAFVVNECRSTIWSPNDKQNRKHYWENGKIL